MVRSSEVVEALCYKSEGRGFETKYSQFFSINLFLPAALPPGVHSTSNRNEYQKQKMSLGSKVRPVLRADNLTAICQSII
jgi:hypothetical protein